MLNLLSTPPKTESFLLACSGGVDSMAAADFFLRGERLFRLAYFNHGTPQATTMQDHVTAWGRANNIPVETGFITSVRDKKSSPEEHWRDERYRWFNSFNEPIVTCHHLNDVAETWIFSSLNGTPKLIRSRIGNIYRPFLLNTKKQLIDWCDWNKVVWIDDKSNNDIHFPRNRIRHVIMPECLKINPGLMKVMKKKLIARETENWKLKHGCV